MSRSNQSSKRNPRKFSEIREIGNNADPSIIDDAAAAFRSISQKHEGPAIREYLSMIVVASPKDTDFGALREFEARRTFASTLLKMMDGSTNDNGKQR